MRAHSQTPYAARLLAGPAISGVALGHGHLFFAGSVLSLTQPGALRMPNGLECDLSVPEPGAPIQIGGGRLESDFGTVYMGPLWNPRPRPRFAVSTQPGLPSWPLLSLAGQGPGLTPLGDDVAAGYLGACALFSGTVSTGLAALLAALTTSLSGTLLRLAALGQLPEAAHQLLEDGDPGPLLSWGASSGSGLLAGLGLHRAAIEMDAVQELDLVLPLDAPRLLRVQVHRVLDALTLAC